MNPNDVMVAALKDILCLLGFRVIYTVYTDVDMGVQNS